MPKFFCDYCDVYLTHDSMSVRKAHNSGRNHLRNVIDYYQQIGHEKAQSVIDSITSSYAAEGQAHNNPMLPHNQPGGGGGLGGLGAGAFPPPAGLPFPPPFPGGIPPPGFPALPPGAAGAGVGVGAGAGGMPPGLPANFPFPPPVVRPGSNQPFPPSRPGVDKHPAAAYPPARERWPGGAPVPAAAAWC
ncbi:U1 small nuclear ribonucleoprotein C [Cytospora paraplurivora]|uniref:U1 small nuclear ribonucleoprotein C n=1 Tax=Cytospora paraplurivora TaxID=2898453 RepID=A0AAN9U7A7_9PEZI